MRFSLFVSLAALVVALLSGCGKPQAMPEVNAANCQIDKIMQIKDEATRREFGSRCSRRLVGPDTLPANPKKW